MRHDIVLRVISKLSIPFIILYAFYIQLHGEQSPGGGFQAGVILASAIILHTIIFGSNRSLKAVPFWSIKFGACLGVIIYGGVGFISLLKGGDYLDYSLLSSNPVKGQRIGIQLVELGVGITVCSVILMIFYMFIARKDL